MTLRFLYLVIASAGIWRLASLLANESGPYHVFAFVRETVLRLEATNRGVGLWMRDFHLHEGLCCEWCCSIWLSIPFTVVWWLVGDRVLIILLPFTLSALAIVFKYLVHTLEQVCSYYENLNKQFERGD